MRVSFKQISTGVLIAVAYMSLSAQTSYHIGEAQGLEIKALVDITKDRDGCMWLGTYDGLFRHEGSRIRNLSKEVGSERHYFRSEFHSVYVDKEGTIWAGSINGLFRINPETFAFKRIFLKPTIGEMQSIGAIYAIFDGYENTLWISSDVGLFHFDKISETYKQIPISKDSLGVPNAITGYKTGVKTTDGIWFHTNEGMVFYNKSKSMFEHKYHNPNKLPVFELSHRFGIGASSYVRPDNLGNIWFINDHRFLIKYNPENHQLDSFEIPLKVTAWNCCQTIAIDHDQNIWVGFRHGGVYVFHPEKKVFTTILHTSPNSLISSNYINSLEVDYEGNIWVGSNKGIDIIDWSENGVSLNQISELPQIANLRHDGGYIYQTENNELLIPFGFFGYIMKDLQRGHTKEYINKDEKNVGNRFFTEFNGYLIGDSGRGVEVIHNMPSKLTDPSYIRRFNAVLSTKPGTVCWAFFRNEREAYFKKTNGLIYHIVHGHIQEIFHGFGFRRNICLSPDSSNIWYLGSNMNLISISLENFQQDTVALHDRLKSIEISFTNPRELLDDGNSIWISSQNGLLEYSSLSDSIKFYTTKDGLSNAFTYSLLKDQSDNIWVASLSGVDYFDRRQSKFINAVSWPLESYMDAFGSGISGKRGELIFAIGNKLITLDPERIRNRNRPTSPLNINQIRINEKPLSFKEVKSTFKFKYDENRLFVQYGLLDFTKKGENEYFYQLQGLDTSWFSDPSRGELSFNSLKPGKYNLNLMVLNPLMEAEGVQTSFSFIIMPPYWDTWWFRLVILVLVFVTGYLFYRYRVEQALKIERLRNKIAADLHDDVASTISSISYYADFARSQADSENPAVQHTLDVIGENARESLETMRDVIWSTQSRYDNFNALKSKLVSFPGKMCTCMGVQFDCIEDKSDGKDFVSPVIRRNIYLIAKEAITNAIKHSNCTHISMELSKTQNNIKLELTDNGKGFDKSQISGGNGLENIASRAEEMAATCLISSEPDKGTTISVVVKL